MLPDPVRTTPRMKEKPALNTPMKVHTKWGGDRRKKKIQKKKMKRK